MKNKSGSSLFPNSTSDRPFFMSMSMFILKALQLLHETPTLPTSTSDHMEKQIMHSLSLLDVINKNIYSRELLLNAYDIDQVAPQPSDDPTRSMLCTQYKQLETTCMKTAFTNTATQSRCLYLIKQLLEHAENELTSPFHRQPSNTGYSASAMTDQMSAHSCKCKEKQE